MKSKVTNTKNVDVSSTIKKGKAVRKVPNVASIGSAVFEQCFALQPAERVLIIADNAKQSEAETLVAAANHRTAQVKLLTFGGTAGSGQEPPPEVAAAMTTADVVLLVTKHSLTHTTARQRACDAGVRIASMPGITIDMIERTLAADYGSLAQLSQALAQKLTAGKKLSITTPTGTKLVADITDRPGIADTGLFHNKGEYGNLPAGEAFVAPLEGSVSGTVVIDASMADIELTEPITIILTNDRATKIAGGTAAQKLEEQLAAAGPTARVVAEIGIGTNPLANPSGDVLEAEKALGTAHLALGDNLGFGGSNAAPFHSDGVMFSPTVTIDDVKLAM